MSEQRSLQGDAAAASAPGESAHEEPTPRLVYTQAPVLLGRLIEPVGERWRAQLGSVERELEVDSAVDPALLTQAHEVGARVLVESAPTPTIVGVVTTGRALRVDRDGAVVEHVQRVQLDAAEEILLRTPSSFVRARAGELELYGERVLTRARNVAKILAALIRLN